MCETLLKIFFIDNFEIIDDVGYQIKQSFVKVYFVPAFLKMLDGTPNEPQNVGMGDFCSLLESLSTVKAENAEYGQENDVMGCYTKDALLVSCWFTIFGEINVLIGYETKDWYFNIDLKSEELLAKMIVEKCEFLVELKRYISGITCVVSSNNVLKEFVRLHQK